MNSCSAVFLIEPISRLNYSSGVIFARTLYLSVFGHVLSFMCFLSFVMAVSDFSIFASKEAASAALRGVLPLWV